LVRIRQKNSAQLWLEQMGYLKPFFFRYLSWLGNALPGDFGISTLYKAPVNEYLWGRLWNTAILGFWVIVLMVPISLTLGIFAGMREGSKLDRTISVTSIITTSVPDFASAVLFAAIFVYVLGWLPGTSSMTSGYDWKQMILPVLVLLVYDFGYVARMTRACMAEVYDNPLYPNCCSKRTALSSGHFETCLTQCPDRSVYRYFAAIHLVVIRRYRR